MATITNVYVDTGATGAANGTSWEDAYTSCDTAFTTEARDITAATGTDEWVRFLCRASTGVIDVVTNAAVRNSEGWTLAVLNQTETFAVDFPANGIYDDTKYVIHHNNDGVYAVGIGSEYTTWHDLQVLVTGSSGQRNGFQTFTISSGVSTIYNCIIKGICSGSGGAYGIYQNRAGHTMNAWNITAQGFRSGTDVQFVPFHGNLGNFNLYNSVCWDAGRAFREGIGVMVVRNSIAGGTVTTDSSGGPNLSNCMTASGVGTNPQTPLSGNFANELTDGANGNFQPVAGGNWEDNGLDDPSAGLYSNDIQGNAYDSPWAIGAYRGLVVAGGGRLLINHGGGINSKLLRGRVA